MDNLANISDIKLPDINLLNWSLSSLATLDLIALGIALLAICFWALSLRHEKRLKKTLQKARDASLYEPQFKCVTFSACDVACRAACAFNTQPILLKDAPMLPLATCSADNCACTLLKFDDRRTGKDRRDNEVLDKIKKSRYANKRTLKDRRRESIQAFLLPKYRMYS